jgi:hypothetical protein
MKMVHSFFVGHGEVLVWLSTVLSLLSSVGVVCLVDHSLLGVFLPCPFGVSSESGWWHLTASTVRPALDLLANLKETREVK